MPHYPETDSHIRDKVRVALDWSSYASKKELNDATVVDTLISLLKVISLL